MSVRGTNSLFFESGIDTSGIQAGSADAIGIVQNLAGTIGKISPFAILASGAVTAFAKIGSDAFKMMREFEQAMKEVETISKATQDDFKGISKEVFALSNISPDSPAKLAKAYYQIASAGYDGADGLKLLETATKAATAGVTDTVTAADGITTVLNAFKLEAKDAENVSDILFTTVRLGKTTFDELSQSLSVVAPLAASSGYNFDEVAAAIASLTKQGVPTAQAMTQIRAGIEATSKVLGDGAAKSMTLQNAFQALYDKAGGSQNKLKELTGSVEAMSGVLAVSGKNAKSAQQDLLEYADAAGATNIANSRMLSSNENQWAILGNRIKATTEEIGKAAVEISSKFAGFVNNALDGGNDIIESYDKQRAGIYKLKNAIESTNEGTKEFKDLRKQIIDQYSEFIGGINQEKASTEDLLVVLDKVNKAYILRYKFEKRQDELKNALGKQGKIEIDLENAQDDFKNQLAALQVLADKKNINLKIDPNLNSVDLIDDIRNQLKDVKGAVIGGVQDQGFGAVPKNGFADDILNNLKEAARAQQDLNSQLNNQKGIVDDLIGRNKRLSQAELKTSEGQAEAIKRINVAMRESDLSDFLGSGIKPIDDAINAREKIINQFRQIDSAKDLKSLKPFLESENDEIKKYTEAKARYLTTNFDGGGGDKGDFLKNLQKEIDEAKQKYQNYFNLVRRGYDDLANAQYGSQLKQGADFEEYLDRRIKAAQNAAEKEALILAKDNKQRTILSAGSFGLSDSQVEKQPSVKIDTKDIEKLLKASGAKGSKGLSDKYKDLTLEPGRKEEKANEKLVNALYQVTDGLYGLSDLYFNITGDEKGANRIAQFAGVAEGAGMIASGNIIGGAMKVLTSAITTEIESNTAVYEEAIAKIEKTIEQLDYTISKSIGSDKINNRKEAIGQLQEMEKQAKLAEEAEKEAEKQVKVLGLTIAKKGKGSGTDQGKLDELEQKAIDARREVEDLKNELNELYTGTTASNLTDSIIQGFKDGKIAAEDFAETFEDAMKNAMLNAFQIKYLEKEIAKFYDKFAEFGADQQYSASEIDALKQLYGSIIEGAKSDIDAINNILESSGMGSLFNGPNNDNREGMSGAIKNITEDTAGAIEGYMNAIRLDTRQGVIIAEKSSIYLSEIAQNTRYNRYLESIDNRMRTVENGILEFQSRS